VDDLTQGCSNVCISLSWWLWWGCYYGLRATAGTQGSAKHNPGGRCGVRADLYTDIFFLTRIFPAGPCVVTLMPSDGKKSILTFEHVSVSFDGVFRD